MERGIEEEGKKMKLHKKGKRVGKADRSWLHLPLPILCFLCLIVPPGLPASTQPFLDLDLCLFKP